MSEHDAGSASGMTQSVRKNAETAGERKNPFAVACRGLGENFRTHIWLEILASMLFVTLVLLSILYLFLQNRYYDDVIHETEKADDAILSVSAEAMSNIFKEQLYIGGEIAVNSALYDIVHGAVKTGRLTYSDEMRLKNEMSTIAVYSDAIASIAVVTEDGLLFEYARYWGYDTPMLWTGENLSALGQMYDDVMKVITEGRPGYFAAGASPLKRTQMPVMTLYHIAFPLLGGYRSLGRVEAAVVITYNMENITRSSAVIGGTSIENTFRYITNDSGLIVFHEDESLTGMTEDAYLKANDLDVSSKPLNNVGLKLNIAIDRQQIRKNVSQLYMRGAVVYIAGILLLFLMWQVMLRSILKPVDIIKKSMEDVEHGHRGKIDIQGEHEIWRLAQEYNNMLDALQNRQEMAQKEYQEKVAMSELRNQAEKIALESQINAHFIFNTLNAINYNAIETGNIETSHLIKRLSNLLQYTLSAQSEVTLGREFNMATEYLYLQKYRLMDKFEYEISFPEEYSEWPCCKLFLQPLVENSIVHGFENTESGGKIWIRGEAEKGRFRVEIGDNGCGMDAGVRNYIMTALEGSHELALTGSGIAIRNVLTRMKMFFGGKFEVSLTSAPGEGTVFVFYLPIPENTIQN